jgi:formate dehydrogenase subunit delta
MSPEDENRSGTEAKLVRMANQIAGFFKTQPQTDIATAVATHINKFWEARMRRQLFEIADRPDNGLSSLVLEAMPLVHRPEPAIQGKTEA